MGVIDHSNRLTLFIELSGGNTGICNLIIIVQYRLSEQFP